MSFLELAKSAGETLLDAGTDLPVIGETIHVGEGIFHRGEAQYDEAHGDEKGAAAQRAEEYTDFAGAIPGVSEAMGVGNTMMGAMSAIFNSRDDVGPVPSSIEEYVGEHAAAGVQNHGTPTGTESGEIGAGVQALNWDNPAAGAQGKQWSEQLDPASGSAPTTGVQLQQEEDQMWGVGPWKNPRHPDSASLFQGMY